MRVNLNQIFKSSSFLCIALLLLLTSFPTAAQGNRRFPPTFPDVRYVEDGDFKQKVDIFLPDTGTDLYPTLLLLHGNGYTKWDMQALAEYFVAQGYAAVAVEYRSPFPQFAQDLFCALAWTHTTAPIYGFDPARLVVLGHSMGGFGAALLAIADEVADFMQDCPHPLPATDRLQGVILYAPGGVDSTDERLDDDERQQLEARLTNQIDGSEPPFLIVHGRNDSRVRARSSENFAATLEEKGVEVTLVLLPGVGHFFTDPQSESGQPAIEAVQVFLDDLFAANIEADLTGE